MPIEAIIAEIEDNANKADDHTLRAALRVAELKRRIDEARPKIKWTSWAPKNIKLSPARIFLLQHIGEAKDPKAELEALRKEKREKAKERRDQQAQAEREREPERKALIEWAKTAEIEAVKNHWARIQRAISARN